MGLSGIAGQIILLRELLVSFHGNEITLGVILANWLILEAIGSFFIGRMAEKTEKRIETYVFIQLVFAIALPWAVYLSRVFKGMLGITPGEALGFAPIFYVSFLILSPVALSHGALFTWGCRLDSDSVREEASSIGRVYVLETVGSIAGGLLITFVLIQYFNAFEIAFAISLTNALISAVLLGPCWKGPWIQLRKGLWILSAMLALFYAYSILGTVAKETHSSSIQSQWKGLQAIHYENSIYGNITVTKRGEQYTFFADGIPSITTPVPDIASIEDFVHFTLLFHEKPESVLILSGGAGGMIHEILKHPVKRVDYVELDPLLLKLVKRFSTPLTQSELSDPRVKVHYTDGRFFLGRTQDRFDIIFIGISAPQELQTNRLFSSEFFSMAKGKINPGGMVVLTLPGSSTYISPELRDLNGCIFDTLKQVYPRVKVIPGDVNLYFASDSDKLATVTAEEMMKRLEKRKLKTSLITRDYIAYRFQERWLKWFDESMEGRKVYINSDFRPLAVFFTLSCWSALFSPYLTGIFKWFEGWSFKMTLVLTLILTLPLLVIFLKNPSSSRYSVPYAIFTSGLADMMFDLAIIFAFQTLYGYLYHQIGLLISVFMVGVALGGLYMTQRLDSLKNHSLIFLVTELGMIGFSFLLPFVFSLPAHHLEKTSVYIFLYAVFLTMCFLCGVLVGLQFPLATRIYLATHQSTGKFGHTAGLLYGADLFGGFFGGLLGGVLLLPILGLKETCFMIAFVKMSSFMLFLVFMKLKK